jgi:bacterioferritin (cytochrome b1)
MTSIRSAVVNELPREERPIALNTAHLITQAAQERNAAHAARQERERQIAAVPDALFDDHPEVQRLRALVAERERRVAQMGPQHRTRIVNRIAQLEAEIDLKERELENAALDDVFDEAMSFERSFAVSEDIRRLKAAIHAAELAHDVLSWQINGSSARQQDELRAAREELFTLLKSLKLQHLNAPNGVQR